MIKLNQLKHTTIEIEEWIPVGWRFDKYDIPYVGEFYLSSKDNRVMQAGFEHEYKQLILKEV